MPVDRRAAFQLGLLVLALPAQYIITRYYGSSDVQRQSAIQKIISSAVGFKNSYLSWKHWQKWCLNVISNIRSNNFGDVGADFDDRGESPAVEVLKYRDQGGEFATSTVPRSPRDVKVKYRIGQVVRHKRWGYRGVIVGWDPKAKAPEEWLSAMHPPDKKHWRNQPNYVILVDTRDRDEPQATYVPQENIDIITEMHVPHWKNIPNYSVLVDSRDRAPPQKTYVVEENIEIVTNVRVIHPELDEYFEGYDGAQYLSRPWLKTVYPHD